MWQDLTAILGSAACVCLGTSQEFCSELTRHVTNQTWTVGELFLVDNLPMAMRAHAEFLDHQGAHSVFAFPMTSALSKAFRVSMLCFWELLSGTVRRRAPADSQDRLGTYI